jgi:phenylpropionate dioxygenase-like ring-hydroxylating dioxygenase large terminal subunit
VSSSEHKAADVEHVRRFSHPNLQPSHSADAAVREEINSVLRQVLDEPAVDFQVKEFVIQHDQAKSEPMHKRSKSTHAEMLTDVWYLAMPARDLKRGKMQPKTLLNRKILFGRGNDGTPFAMRDVCPHRGIPLSHGRFDGKEIECCYHGWRFDCQGACTFIPSLLPDQKFDVNRVSVLNYPCREIQGNVWVFIPSSERQLPDPLPEIPVFPDVTTDHYRLVVKSIFPCTIDHAVVGLMDPAHGPFVHRSWWWRSGHSIHEKSKVFAPSKWGFTMVRHKPSSNSKAYKILGGEISTEIRFELPGVRVEHIRAGKHCVCGVTTLTPLTDEQVELHQIFYWTTPFLSFVRPVLKRFIKKFIEQDRDVVDKQREGLNDDPQLILINDADKPARWYHQLKKELISSRSENREFCNPVPHTTLHWRS